MGVAAMGVAAVVVIVAVTGGGASSPRRASGPFAWLRPAPPPSGWNLARTASATLAYPPGWTAIKTDPGTSSAALLGPSNRIEGYLNATPRQGPETLANWTRFRPQHNRAEGDGAVRLIAASSHARFRSGAGSCVIDAYTTSVTSYQEIACLVSGPTSSAVVVAAAPSALWQERSAVLERAVSSFVA
jgi:hypothetical protein